MKALILARTPSAERPATFKKISQGQQGHNLEALKEHLKLKLQCPMPAVVTARFRDTLRWTTDWRYRVGTGSAVETKTFLAAVRVVLDWVERSI